MTRTTTVLVLEDDDYVRRLVTDSLTSIGYRVLTAAHADEAFRHLETETVDLLLSDVVLPRISGPACAIELLKKAPKLRVLFMSGYLDPDLLRRLGLEERMPFLQKPFSLTLLRDSVADMLVEAAA